LKKTIVFDMGGVLLDFNPNRYVYRHNLQGEDRNLILREVFGSYEWLQLDRGDATYEEAIESMCKRLPEHLHEECRYFVYNWWVGPIYPIPGMEQLMRDLYQKGIEMYVLSNAALSLRKYAFRVPGFQFAKDIFVSAEWKMLKPERQIFEKFLDVFQLDADNCFFIDDNPANVAGAIQAGIHGAVFYGDVNRVRTQIGEFLGMEL